MKIEIDIDCPSCNHSFKQKLENLRPGNSCKCPSCGSEINFTGDDASKVQKAIDDLEKSMDGLGNMKF